MRYNVIMATAILRLGGTFRAEIRRNVYGCLFGRENSNATRLAWRSRRRNRLQLSPPPPRSWGWSPCRARAGAAGRHAGSDADGCSFRPTAISVDVGGRHDLLAA